MKFKQFISEAIVKFNNISDAIKKTLQFIVNDGTWKFREKPYGISGLKTITVAGHFYCDKGHFFLTANTIADKPIDSYDSQTGVIDQNTKIEIIASLSLINDKNSLKKIGERSNDSGGRLNTPYQLAIWVKQMIDNYEDNDNGGNEDTPDLSPSPRELVSV